MKALRHSVLWLMLAASMAPLTACNDGPLENAGEEIDDAVDDAADNIDRRN